MEKGEADEVMKGIKKKKNWNSWSFLRLIYFLIINTIS